MPVEDLVIVHVMAEEGEEFSGTAVLEILLMSGLRHGAMDIFHYRNQQGVVEFSLANCLHPGTFNPDAMNQLNTPGITLFMQLPMQGDAFEALDHMLEMGDFLAKHLEGKLLDEEHCALTKQRTQFYRDKIRAVQRNQLLPNS